MSARNCLYASHERETPVARLAVAVLAVSSPVAAVGLTSDTPQQLRSGHRQRLQHHLLDEREDGRGCANAEGQSQDRDGCEGLIAAKLAQSIADVPGQKSPHSAQRELRELLPSPALYRQSRLGLLALPPPAKALARFSPASGLPALNGVHHRAPAQCRACETDSEVNSEFAWP